MANINHFAYTRVYARACVLNKIRLALSLKDFLHGQGPPFRAIDVDKENYIE